MAIEPTSKPRCRRLSMRPLFPLRPARPSRPLGDVLPVAAAVVAHGLVDAQRLELGGADRDLAAQQERQQPHAQAGALEARERLVAEARRVAERRAADFDRDPREHRERQIAFDDELAARSLLDRRAISSR